MQSLQCWVVALLYVALQSNTSFDSHCKALSLRLLLQEKIFCWINSAAGFLGPAAYKRDSRREKTGRRKSKVTLFRKRSQNSLQSRRDGFNLNYINVLCCNIWSPYWSQCWFLSCNNRRTRTAETLSNSCFSLKMEHFELETTLTLVGRCVLLN